LNEIIEQNKKEHITEIVEKVKAGDIKHDGTTSRDLRHIARIGFKLKILDEE
jgi:protein-arginine kinase activator protein McsA